MGTHPLQPSSKGPQAVSQLGYNRNGTVLRTSKKGGQKFKKDLLPFNLKKNVHFFKCYANTRFIYT